MSKSSLPYQKWSIQLLAATVWISALLFGLFILSFYFIALFEGNTAQWNEVLPGLYDEDTRAATVGIGAHFAAGGIILILGCIQLLSSLRKKYPQLHRWLGRLYVLSALLAAMGGLVFIFLKGTIGAHTGAFSTHPVPYSGHLLLYGSPLGASDYRPFHLSKPVLLLPL